MSGLVMIELPAWLHYRKYLHTAVAQQALQHSQYGRSKPEVCQ